MKYFGEYLVSKGLLTEDALVDALIEQVRSIPSMAEVLFKKKTLSTNDFLSAFRVQSEKQVDFKQACIQASVWSEALETLVIQEVQAAKVPLGQILIQKGLVDLSTLTKALDEFLSRIEAPELAPVPVPVKGATPELAAAPETGAALAAAPAVGPSIDPVLLEDFFSTLNEKKLLEIKNQFNGLKLFGSDSELQKTALQSILTEIHLVRGLMRFIRLEKFESLLSQLETLCVGLIAQIEAGHPTDLTLFAVIGFTSFTLISDLTGVLSKNPHESAWFSDLNRDRQFNQLFTQMSEVHTGG